MNKKSKVYPLASHALWEEQFNRRLSWPASWYMSAISLKRAVDLLLPSINKDYEDILADRISDNLPSISAVCLLLIGYAIENILKGLCVIKHGAFNTNGNFKYSSHNLLNLSEYSWNYIVN
jgi:hypothetical protein